MNLKSAIIAKILAGEAPGFVNLCLFTMATGLAALLNNRATGNDPRFTVFATGLCVLGLLAVVLEIITVYLIVRTIGKNRKEHQ